MIHLRAKGNKALSAITHTQPLIAKISTNVNLPVGLRSQTIVVMPKADEIPTGFALTALAHDVELQAYPENTIRLSTDIRYLKEHDVVQYNPKDSSINVLYRKEANVNSFLLTERCNSFCIMCSQPPRVIDDGYLVDDLLNTLPLIHPDTPEIGFTGGETTLVGEKLITLIQAAKNHLPRTALHILSNGRSFENLELARQVAAVKHPDIMIGIPLYADYSQLHDFIVQADGAFDQTVRGILNLKRCSVPVEIRVVIHKENFHRLPKLAEFLARNLLFVDHVALMGLEIIGFAKSNLESLWIDPYDYRDELEKAVEILDSSGMKVSIYNTPLCLLSEKVRRFAAKSISDWKNQYPAECDGCSQRNLCAGFFTWNLIAKSSYLAKL